MRKNVIFETVSGNKYLYTESTQYFILLHPLLEDSIQPKNLFTVNQYAENDADYYRRKYLFLLDHGILGHIETPFLTKPDSEVIKIKLANLRQLLFEVTDGCNLKCYYCGYGELYNNYDKRISSKLSFEKVKVTNDYMVE